MKNQNNPFRITLKQVVENEGVENLDDLFEQFGHDSVMPACCSEGCVTEPDGTCEHGCPSILLAAGFI